VGVDRHAVAGRAVDDRDVEQLAGGRGSGSRGGKDAGGERCDESLHGALLSGGQDTSLKTAAPGERG
jgi:hypothetical protein